MLRWDIRGAPTGSENEVADLAQALLGLRLGNFVVFAEDRRAAEWFRALGAEVFEGPVGDLFGQLDP